MTEDDSGFLIPGSEEKEIGGGDEEEVVFPDPAAPASDCSSFQQLKDSSHDPVLTAASAPLLSRMMMAAAPSAVRDVHHQRSHEKVANGGHGRPPQHQPEVLTMLSPCTTDVDSMEMAYRTNILACRPRATF